MSDTAYLLALIRKPHTNSGGYPGVMCEVDFDVFSEDTPSNFPDFTWATIHKIKASDFEEACLRMADYVTATRPWLWDHLGRFKRTVDAIRHLRTVRPGVVK